MMNMEEYGDKENYYNHLLEQYKLVAEMQDRIQTIRALRNRFYTILLSGLIAFIPILFALFTKVIKLKYFLGYPLNTVILMGSVLFISLLGFTLSCIWYSNLCKHKRLNSAKFALLEEMEKKLPHPCYTKERELLGFKDPADYLERRKSKKTLTNIERRVPFSFGILFGLLFLSFLYFVLKEFII